MDKIKGFACAPLICMLKKRSPLCARQIQHNSAVYPRDTYNRSSLITPTHSIQTPLPPCHLNQTKIRFVSVFKCLNTRSDHHADASHASIPAAAEKSIFLKVHFENICCYWVDCIRMKSTLTPI